MHYSCAVSPNGACRTKPSPLQSFKWQSEIVEGLVLRRCGALSEVAEGLALGRCGPQRQDKSSKKVISMTFANATQFRTLAELVKVRKTFDISVGKQTICNLFVLSPCYPLI